MAYTLEEAMAGKEARYESEGDTAAAASADESATQNETQDVPSAANAAAASHDTEDHDAVEESGEDDGDADPTPGQPANFRAQRQELKKAVTERNDWKGKAQMAEGQLSVLQQQISAMQEQMRVMYQHGSQQGQQPAQPAADDPVAQLQELIRQESQREARQIADQTRLDVSERWARDKHGTEKVDEAFATFQQVVKNHPQGQAIYATVMQSRDPWGEVMKVAQRQAIMTEVGDKDLATLKAEWREQVKAELMAEMKQQPAQTQQSVTAAIPRSMGAQRSVAGAGSYAGPPTLESLIGY